MISENSLELLEYPKLLGIIAEQAHCPATRQAVLAIRPYGNLPDILQRQRLVEELRRLSAEGPLCCSSPLPILNHFWKRLRPVGAVLDPLELSVFMPLLQLSSAISGQIKEDRRSPLFKNTDPEFKGFSGSDGLSGKGPGSGRQYPGSGLPLTG